MKNMFLRISILILFVALGFYANPRSSHAVSFNTGDVFAAVSNGLVQHYDSAGNFIENLDTTNGGFTTGMAFDASGNLYVTNFSTSQVAKFDNTGALVSSDFLAGLSTPESIVFDAAGNMYVGNLDNGIRKYDSTGAFQGTVINTRVDFFDLSADQSTFVYGQEGIDVKTVSNALPGTSGADFTTGTAQQAFAMRILGDGGLLLADNDNIKRFNSAGVVTQTYGVAGENFWFSLNLDPDGTSFWSGDVSTQNFYKFDIASGNILTGAINTGTGANTFFGLTVFGEITAGGPGSEPVPEPATIALLGIGLVGLAGAEVRRRRKKKAVS